MDSKTDTSPAGVHVACLHGETTVLRDGTTLPLSRKQVALLRYVAAEHRGNRLDADSLAEMLWPSPDPKRSRHSLRQAISEIGKAAPELELHIQRGKVEFVGRLLTSDVSLFEVAARTDNSEQLLSLFQSPPEVEDVGGREYYEWQEGERDRIQAMFSQAIKRFIRTFSTEADWPEVERCASALLKFERDEEVIESWITAILLQDEPGRAQREVQALTLADGEDLSPQCIAFLKRVETDLSTEATLRSPGFVGRRAELHAMIEAWKRPSTRAVLLQGDGGIGKTTLAHQFLRYAALKGATCIVVVCDRHRRHIPYATVLDIINAAPARFVARLTREQADVLREIALGAIAIREDARTGPTTSTADEIGRILETMFSQERTGSIVLFLDDVQHADASSIEVISDRFGRSREPGSPHVLFASRTAEATGLKLPMRFGASFELIKVDRLDPETVNAYIDAFETRNKIRLTENDRTAVARVAGGEPFYLETLLNSITTRGRVQELQTAGRLTELIQQRIEPLSDEAMSVLGVIACASRPITLEPIIAASGLSETAVLRAIEALLRARLVEEVRSQIVVSHDLIGEAVSRLSARFRTQLYHRRLAEYFESVRTPDHSFLAYQYERADRPEEAFSHLLAAAAHAEKFLAVTETEALLRRAIVVAAPEKRHEARRKLAGLFLRTSRYRECIELSTQFQEGIAGIELECALAQALTDLRAADDSHINENSLNNLIDLTDQIGDPAIQIVALNEFVLQAYGRGNASVTSALIDRAEALLPRLRDTEQARLRLVLKPLLDLVRPERDLGTDSAGITLEAEDWRARAKSLTVAGRASMLGGRPSEACDLFAQARALLEEHDAQELFNHGLPNYALALWQKGDLAGAASMFERGSTFATKTGDTYQARLCTANLAALRYELGNVEEARRMAGELFDEQGARLIIHLAAASILGLIALAEGDLARAEQMKTVFAENREGAALICLGHHHSVFLANYTRITDGIPAAIGILDEAIELERHRDVPAAMALRLERAKMIADQDRETALTELKEVEDLCRERGLHEHDARIQELKLILGVVAAET